MDDEAPKDHGGSIRPHDDGGDVPPVSPGRSTRNRPTDDELLDAACEVIAEVGAERATMTASPSAAGPPG